MWSEYLLFLLKTGTLVIALLVIVGGIVRASRGSVHLPNQGRLVITHLNDALEKLRTKMQSEVLEKKALKAQLKKAKAQKKKAASDEKQKAYFIRFKGDIQAAQVKSLRQEVTAILSVAEPGEEVVVAIDSPGGAVSGYGLAASQLQRLKAADLRLTACVDKVAASGGYMMACIADKILAAPFAIVGSIGVLSQIPNVHQLLKKNGVDVDVLTSGKHKAPMTLLGENTDEGRAKHKEDLAAIHERFKTLVKSNREALDIDAVSEGDYWLAEDAIDKKLVDDIKTSDSYLSELCETANVYRVEWLPNKTLEERFKRASAGVLSTIDNLVNKRRLP